MSAERIIGEGHASAKDVFAHTDFEKEKKDWHWVESEEPHVTRRAQILKAHPEIKKLYGPEPLTIPILFFVVALQMASAYAATFMPWWAVCLFGWVWGGTWNHSLQLAAHELSHGAAGGSRRRNAFLGIVCNIPTMVPSAMSFFRYHPEHHSGQGYDVVDTDVPSAIEVKFFTTTLRKLVWLTLQPFFYALRPLMVNPKKMVPLEMLNWAVIVACDVALYLAFGWKGVAYLVIGTFLGLGLHPSAGHFIAEHYEFVEGQETYSYYGPWNLTNWNVGYHVEHHDFPQVPWSRLHKIREMAPEFYEHLPYHTSYTEVLYRFVTDPNIGPWSRIKRFPKKTLQKVSKSAIRAKAKDVQTAAQQSMPVRRRKKLRAE
ncbi:MAG: hypothetical protein MHM6MM_006658 [Cercozoa sp. M6MM]